MRTYFIIMIALFMSTASFAFSGGNGTQSDPIRISTKADWEEFCNMSGTSAGLYFRLTQNLTGRVNTVTTRRNTFSGYFDGRGNEIEVNLSGGLFGTLGSGGVIENLIVSGEIERSGDNGGNLGGICDYGSGSITIRKCQNKITIQVTPGTYSVNVGGIIGRIEANTNTRATITNCFNTGEIKGTRRGGSALTTGMPSIGGIAGQVAYTDITNCYNAGNIIMSGYVIPSSDFYGRAAGICIAYGGNTVNLPATSTRIENCFSANEMLVTAPSILSPSHTSAYRIGNATLQNNYALSTMRMNGVLVEERNTHKEVNGENTSATNFQSQSWIVNNLGWDFNSVWKITSGSYPVLQFSSITGNEAVRNTSVVLSPNPAENSLHIHSDIPITKMDIYSLSGKLVLSTVSCGEMVSLASLNNGMYIVKIETQNEVITQKIIVRKN